MIINTKEIIDQVEISINFLIKGIGKRIAISTSNTKKIIAIMKNRSENGIRELEKGSNPHSKGDAFSRSSEVFLLSILAVIMITNASSMITKIVVKTLNIVFFEYQTFSLEVRYTYYNKKTWSPPINCDKKE